MRMRRAHRSATDGRGRNRSLPEAVRRCPRVRREHPAPIARPNWRNAGLADAFEQNESKSCFLAC